MSEQIKTKTFTGNPGTADWRVTSEGACAFYRTPGLAESTRFVAAVADVAGLADQAFGIDVRRGGVLVRTVTERSDLFGLSQADLDVALGVSAVAAQMGLTADPSQVQGLLFIPGAPDRAKIMPFWQAVMGYVPRPDSPDEDLVDPRDRNAPMWFEEMESARPGNLGAIHLAVWVGIDQAQARVDAALAAGGKLVRDDYAPAWWTLADAYGNEVDVATVEYRDEPLPG
jgi:4a-hydroxytetrahydrobiopterin dehydratase